MSKGHCANFRYIVWKSFNRGDRNRDQKLVECSTLCTAVDYATGNSSFWIEPVRAL